jgi:hypothetical protein
VEVTCISRVCRNTPPPFSKTKGKQQKEKTKQPDASHEHGVNQTYNSSHEHGVNQTYNSSHEHGVNQTHNSSHEHGVNQTHNSSVVWH